MREQLEKIKSEALSEIEKAIDSKKIDDIRD